MKTKEISELRKLNARLALDVRLLTANELSETFECAVDGRNGIYCAQVFAERYCKGFDCEISETAISILLDGPDNELYLEAQGTLDNWIYESNGNEYKLHIGESGDYFVYDNALILLWESLTEKNFWDELV